MTKGYKATCNYKCRDQLYEIGQEYKIEGEPEICRKGFHYCKNAMNVLTYYPIQLGFKLLEIEDLSTETVHEYDKSCSNYIRIIREIIDPEEMMNLLQYNLTYNESTKTLKVNYFDGFWYEHIYNEAGQISTYKDSNGLWGEYTYNEAGQELTYKNSDDCWTECTYNEAGQKLTYKNSDGLYLNYTEESN